MNRIERLYAIIEEPRAAGGRGRTAEWLAERSEVSSRIWVRPANDCHLRRAARRRPPGRAGMS
jgi:hypothetical protein